MTSQIAQNLNRVLHSIVQVSSARPVTLVAVSKTKPASLLLEAYNAGQRHFGENYVHEILEKSKELPQDIKWHFIGHLQSNKVKQVCSVPNLYMVETVDRQKIAKSLNDAIKSQDRKLKVLVQVNTSNEESKSGCDPSETLNLCRYVINECPNLDLCGFMTIGDLSNSKRSDENPDFEQLVSVRDSVCDELKLDKNNLELSMGMSSDYETAVCVTHKQ
jgi:pyridoxal phosphate enzyme (YggS family)